LHRDPDRLQYALPIAQALQQLDRTDEAIEYLKQAAMQGELRAEACLQLGELLEKSRRIPEALSAYRRAALFRVPPPSAEIKLKALQAAARLAQQHQLIDSARRYLEMLIELSPDDPRLAERLRALPAVF
jgi:tetratricopeptide (TPR) repeat protein